MVYEWTSMSEMFKVDAQTVGETIERIEAEQGCVTKENFLEASRPESSPTHKLFEWDNEKAAEKYRLYQSNIVINHIAVKVVASDESAPQTTRAYVNIEPKGSPQARFVNVVTALQDDEMRQIVLQNAYRELKQFESKYAQYTELSSVFEAIDRLEIG